MKEQLSEIWGRLDARQRRTLILVGGLTVVMLAVVLRRSLQPEWTLLYGGLEADTASAIVEELQTEKVPYSLARQGTAIMVEKQRVYDLRLQLANKGLPGGGGVGFEIFDRSSLPGTEFSNQVNLQRALQGELSRSINCVQEVMASRVHLVLSKESLYGRDTQASASVVLTLRPGGQLSQSQVQGVVNLVAAAVPDLKPHLVTVVDASGSILSSGMEDSEATGRMSAAQLETKRQFEESLRQRLQSMLDAVVGQHQAIVSAQVDLSFDTEQVQSEVYSEPEGRNGGLTSAHVVEESYEGAGKPGARSLGMSANVDSAIAEGGRAGGKYLSREETRQYELSRQVIERTTAAGQIKRLTVAAIVDEGMPGASVSKVREILEAASGYDEARGDKLVIQNMPIAAKEAAATSEKQAEEATAAAHRQQMTASIAHYGSGLAAIVVLGGAILLATRQVRNALSGSAQSSQRQLPTLPEAGAEAEARGDVVDIAENALRGPPTEYEATSAELAEAVRRLAAEKPEAVSRQLERWLAGG